MVSPDSVWYELVLLLFSATAQTDTGPNHLTVPTCQRLKYMMILIIVIIVIIFTIVIIVIIIYYLILLRLL
jgi:hypothetical protein